MSEWALLQEYKPAKLKIGCPHPDPVVESNSLMSVDPPELPYQDHHHLQVSLTLSHLHGVRQQSLALSHHQLRQALWATRAPQTFAVFTVTSLHLDIVMLLVRTCAQG